MASIFRWLQSIVPQSRNCAALVTANRVYPNAVTALRLLRPTTDFIGDGEGDFKRLLVVEPRIASGVIGGVQVGFA